MNGTFEIYLAFEGKQYGFHHKMINTKKFYFVFEKIKKM